MKKRLLLLLLAAVTAFSTAFFTGCSKYGSLKVTGKQDTSYAVTSNGGMAVGYGNYVYFVNGYRTTDDPKGDNNKFGEVVQGGIFRAEFVAADEQDDNMFPGSTKGFIPNGADLPFTKNIGIKNPYYYFNLDGSAINDEDEIIENDTEEQRFFIDEIKVQQVVSKSVSADANGAGGLYIFGDYIYYASRNNEENKNGVVQSDLYDFYRTKVNGTGTQRIYTTTSGENIQYAFYSFKGDVYLVVHEGSKLTSVQITRKAQKPVTIAENISGAVLPKKTTYYKGISENTIYDYIFFTRAVDDDDTQATGVMGECVRPDGTGRTELLSNQSSLSFLSVRDDSVYFTETQALNTRLVRVSPNFADGVSAGELELGKSVVLASTANYSNLIPFREKHTDGVSAGETALFTAGGSLVLSRGGVMTTLVSGSVTVNAVEDGFVYYTQDNLLYRVSLANTGTAEQAATQTISATAFFNIDFVNGFLFYTASSRFEWAPHYLYVKRVSSYANTDEMFIGKIEQENPSIAIHEEHDEENHYNPVD